MPDSIINGVPWTLGEYIKLHGGNQNRSKKVWGINIPIDVEEDGMKTHDSVIAIMHAYIQAALYCIFGNLAKFYMHYPLCGSAHNRQLL